MRIIILLCCIVVLIACHNDTEKSAPAIIKGVEKDSKYAGILAKCKLITIDTFRVHYDENMDDTLGVSDNYAFKGVLLDGAESSLFPAEVLTGSMGVAYNNYACYSFAIDDGHTGIIARMSSMYKSLSIRLFTLDHQQDTLTDFIELANFEGDGGEYSEKQTWLYKISNKFAAYIHAQDSYDHSMDGEGDTTVERTNYYYVLDLSKPKYDTINRNAGALLKTFQAVNRN